MEKVKNKKLNHFENLFIVFHQFFESLCLHPTIKYSSKQVQSAFTCGFYACVFAFFSCKNKSLEEFSIQFDDLLIQNDLKVVELFKSNFSLHPEI